MKIQITQDISGTGDYRWTLFTGPEELKDTLLQIVYQDYLEAE